MTRNCCGWLPAILALVVAAVVACGNEPGQSPPGPATTPPPTATSPATATTRPEAAATASHQTTAAPTATPVPVATAAPSPSPTPIPATATAPPSATPTEPSPTAFRYDTYDLSGTVATPGSYAFLATAADLSSVVTTYEGLRDGTATALIIHTTDAGGVSRADVYDAVEAGDLFEWRKADDCFVRYTVEEVMADPAGTVPRKLLGVAWMTYAFTGCSGAVPATATVTMGWGPLPSLGGTSLTAPVIHGPYQIVPADWEGPTRASEDYPPPGASHENPVYTTDIAEARNLPYWRDPTPPPGWTFAHASSGGLADPGYGYSAEWRRPGRISGFRVFGYHASGWYYPQDSSWQHGASIIETRVIAGRPAFVSYTPRRPAGFVEVFAYDAAMESMYRVFGDDYSLNSHNVESVIAIVQSLFAEPSEPSPTAFPYDAYDATGAVATPGSYAFLADADDLSSVVKTYEGLRDGTATALLIHTSDSDGVSRADVYDAVEAGDLFEWRKADDCFVRYTVEEVMADPAGTVPRKLLGVAWMTYAFTGCSGAVPATATVTMGWGPLPSLGGTSLTAPVIHGPYQIVPADWEGPTRASESYPPPGASHENPVYTTDISEARNLPYWRDPTPPPGWTFAYASSGAHRDPGYGYSAEWRRPGRISGFRVFRYHGGGWYYPEDSSWHNGSSVRETRVIAGRPAFVSYSLHRPGAGVHVLVYDAATESMYRVLGDDYSINSHNFEAVIAIAESLFAEPSEPRPTVFRYDRYDSTGAVAEPGSFAFLADPNDPASVVTSYEGLRDGTATALVIHTTDADGVSRSGVYDAVEAGTRFEWRQADDCWVRYRVTFAPTGATGATRTLGVDWQAYTYTGCRGTIDPDRAYRIGWNPPVIASRATGSRPVTLITSPIRFGPFLLFRDREDELEPFVELWSEPPGRASGESASTQPEWPSRDPDEVRQHPLWRDPVLPAGWVLTGHEAHDLGWVSVFAVNETDDYGLEVHIAWSPWGPRRESVSANAPGVNISEARIIDGHPAVLWYDPTGTLDIPVNLVRIFDESTGVIYSVAGYTGVDIDTLIAIALSFLRG